MSEATVVSSAVKKSRSPSYPGIALDLAISRARVLYQVEKRNAAPVAAIQAHWGYTPNNSSSNVTLAALKKFGLITDEGSGPNRQARLTDLALEILLNPNPGEWIRKAALTPKIHQELWQKYRSDGLPSDPTLKHELVMSRHFTEAGAIDFIKQFRKTITFAQLDAADESAEGPAAAMDAVREPTPAQTPAEPLPQAPALQSAVVVSPASPQAPLAVTIPILLPGGSFVQLSGNFPISEAAWKQMIKVIEANKLGLVASQD